MRKPDLGEICPDVSSMQKNKKCMVRCHMKKPDTPSNAILIYSQASSARLMSLMGKATQEGELSGFASFLYSPFGGMRELRQIDNVFSSEFSCNNPSLPVVLMDY